MQHGIRKDHNFFSITIAIPFIITLPLFRNIQATRIGTDCWHISMLVGGAVSAAIQIGVTALSGGGYGGADWKLSSACAFLLGWQRGLAGK